MGKSCRNVPLWASLFGVSRIAFQLGLCFLCGMKRMLMVMTAVLWIVSVQAEKSLDIYWVDVEGGAATLIVTPAGQSILQKYFPGGVNPGKLALSALIPTIIMGLCFMGLPTVSEESDPQRHKVSVPTESSESG